MRHAPFIRELMPVPELRINPKTAAEYGIEHLDWVKITSRRGSSHARAYLTEGIAPGVLITERFWNPECFDDTQSSITPGFEECGYNVMSADEFQNPVLRARTATARSRSRSRSPTRPPRVCGSKASSSRPSCLTLRDEPVTEEVF